MNRSQLRGRCATPVRRAACSAVVALLPVLSATSAVAQNPRFGADEGQFRITRTESMKMTMMGTSMDMDQKIVALSRIRVKALKGDTLSLTVYVDSVEFSATSPMLTSTGMSPADLMPYRKGDSAVTLINSRGVVLRHVAGNEDVNTFLDVSTNLPGSVTPGQTWTSPPPNLTGGSSGDPRLDAMFQQITERLKDELKITYHGEVDRDGTRAWKFSKVIDVSNVPVSMPGSPLSMTIRSISGTGASFISTSGRMLHGESLLTAMFDLQGGGNSIPMQLSSSMLVERLR